jgi:hypothetical protein
MESGFLTNTGRYVSREEALRIATNNSPDFAGGLRSEDALYRHHLLSNERGALGGPRTILRVENEAGRGPYNTNSFLLPYDSDPRVPAGDRQPLPRAPEWRKMDRDEQQRYLFGFRDANQLKRWFTPYELQSLAEHGFHVQPYEVPQHIYDRSQAMFERGNARRANATPLSTDADPMIPRMNGEGNAALPMLGLSGGAALGGLSLWELLNRRR